MIKSTIAKEIISNEFLYNKALPARSNLSSNWNSAWNDSLKLSITLINISIMQMKNFSLVYPLIKVKTNDAISIATTANTLEYR